MTKQVDIANNLNYVKVLNEGFVGLVDHMGNDSSIVQAARVSYGKGTKKISEDRGLIRYLVRHAHTTPLEMVVFKFHSKMPIFVARQWIRHRTASVNEYSGRYSEMSEDMYLPELEQIKPQSTTNKQGRGGSFSTEKATSIQLDIEEANTISQERYQNLMNKDLSKELARGVLSVNNYTEWYWQSDLHNLFHFLKLRLDKGAQYEIRVYAEAMYNLIKKIVPFACEAFEDYIFNTETGTYQSYHISKQELNILKELLRDAGKYMEITLESSGLSTRELAEFKQKFGIQ